MKHEPPDASARVGYMRNFTDDLRRAGFVVPTDTPFVAEVGSARCRYIEHLLSICVSRESLGHTLRQIVAEGSDREAFLAIVELIKSGWISQPAVDHSSCADWLDFLAQEGRPCGGQGDLEITLEERLNWLLVLGVPAKCQALHSAARAGNEYILALLIKGSALNPNAINRDGLTPLACAAEAGQLGAVELFCGMPEIDPNIGNPLVLALTQGHGDVFRVLLGMPGISFDPLALLGAAIANGRVEILDLLLKQELLSDWHLGNTVINAIENNQPRILQYLLSLREPIDCNEGTPLRRAVELGYVEIVGILLDEVEWLNVDLGVPLSIAIRHGKLEIVTLLLQKARGSETNISELLQIAISSGHIEVIKMLLDHAASFGLDFAVLLRCALKANNGPVVKLLLERCRSLELNYGQILWVALDKGNLEVVSLILEAAPDLNVNYFESVRVERSAGTFDVVEVSSLLKAVQYGRADMVECLAKHPRLDPNIGCPLFCALENMHAGLVGTLLAIPGLDRDATNHLGETALHVAVKQDDPDLVRAVVAAGFNVNAKSHIGISVLHLVIDKRQTESLELLLSMPQLDLNGIDRGGDTAIHHAVRIGFVDGVRLLLQHPEVDLSLRDRRGMTPPRLAKMMAKLWGNMQNFNYIEALLTAQSSESGLSRVLHMIGTVGSVAPVGNQVGGSNH